MVWALVVPANLTLLTDNQRMHWAVRRRHVLALREWGRWQARRQGVPACERVWAALVVYPVTRRRFDPANWSPTAKALVDGALVDSGVLRDDDARHLLSLTFTAGGVVSGGSRRVVLYITDRAPSAHRWWDTAEEAQGWAPPRYATNSSENSSKS